MTDIAIRVENLSKLYQIGAHQERHDTLRDALAHLLRRPAPVSAATATRPSDTDLWALRDVSFDVKQGEVVGIIGRNGAGKSTLLNILSRITKPTTGYADIYGRIGSLLEPEGVALATTILDGAARSGFTAPPNSPCSPDWNAKPTAESLLPLS